jgi:exonuclease III
MVLEDETPRSEGAEKMTGEEPRSSTISTVNNDAIESKPKGSSIAEHYRYKRKDQSFLKTYKIGTWTVRSMNQGKLEIVKSEMDRIKIDILGISELKWTGSGHFTSNNYEVYYSGNQNTRKNGVAMVLNKKFVNSVIGYYPKNDRMISIRLQGKPTNLTIIQIYAPTTEAEESTIEDFYMDLQQILDEVPKKDAILIIGDWNAKVGETAVPGIVGKFGLGKRNVAGERLIDFCQENQMIITNTCFQQPKRRLYTWTTPNGQHRNQIDYILCNRRWKSSITSVKTRPGADCGTDHELLLACFRIKLKQHHKPTHTAKPDLQNIPYKYKVEVKNRFDALNLIDKEPEELWQEIRDIINDETKRNIPTIPKKKKNNWISSSTLEIAKRRQEAKANGNRQAFTKLNADFQRAVRKDKEKQIMQDCEQVEEYNKKGMTRDLFKKIKHLRGQFIPKNGTLIDPNGKHLSNGHEIKNKWKQYTEELYKKEINGTGNLELDDYELEPDILDSEVKFAMEQLANGKAPGHDGIPIECFKAIKEDAVKILTKFCQQIWKTQKWPQDWKTSIFIPIPKNGNAKDCSNYRTIALISHASKIMLKIIQRRLEPFLEREMPVTQAGFRKGRGTRDQIANLRWLMEKAREYQKEFYLCFIDYSKAFDCVDHEKLWSVLLEMGVPKHLIILMKNLYTDQQASVKTDYGNTNWFNIGKGVRQGCILSPYLFNLYAEHIMRKAGIDEAAGGIKIGGRNINNLRYADDTTILAETADDLQCLLRKVKEESAAARLKLNMKKTFVMTNGPIQEFHIDNDQVEIVKEFIFLGSSISTDGNCSNEIKRRLLMGRKAMVSLDKLIKSKDVSLATKIRVIKTMVFPVTTYGCESWTIKQADRRKIDAFELWCWRRLLRVPWTEKRTNKSVLQEIKPECSLEASMVKLKLSYFGHIMRRQDSLEKEIMLGMVGGKRRRGRQKERWTDTIKEDTNLTITQLNTMVHNRNKWRSLIHRIAKSRTRLNG